MENKALLLVALNRVTAVLGEGWCWWTMSCLPPSWNGTVAFCGWMLGSEAVRTGLVIEDVDLW